MKTPNRWEIRIDDPGAGEWLSEQAHGLFTPGRDHTFTSHRDGKLLGGFMVQHYIGNSMQVHAAGISKYWASRELFWLVSDYIFNQLGCYKAIAMIRSDNDSSLAFTLRAGGSVEAVIKDAFASGVHLVMVTMTKDACPWLDYKPKRWASRRTV